MPSPNMMLARLSALPHVSRRRDERSSCDMLNDSISSGRPTLGTGETVFGVAVVYPDGQARRDQRERGCVSVKGKAGRQAGRQRKREREMNRWMDIHKQREGGVQHVAVAEPTLKTKRD